MNFQHNCHDGKCPVFIQNDTQSGKKEGSAETYSINHTNYPGYILNVGSLRNPENYRRLSALQPQNITGEMWNESLQKGVEKWKSQGTPRATLVQTEPQREDLKIKKYDQSNHAPGPNFNKTILVSNDSNSQRHTSTLKRASSQSYFTKEYSPYVDPKLYTNIYDSSTLPHVHVDRQKIKSNTMTSYQHPETNRDKSNTRSTRGPEIINFNHPSLEYHKRQSSAFSSNLEHTFDNMQIIPSASVNMTHYQSNGSINQGRKRQLSGSNYELKLSPRFQHERKDLIDHFPQNLIPYIENIIDVEADGHCGYRVAAHCVGLGQDSYMKIREKLSEEIQMRKQFYLDQGTFMSMKEIDEALESINVSSPRPCGIKHWMTMPSLADPLANAYGAPVFFHSPGDNSWHLV